MEQTATRRDDRRQRIMQVMAARRERRQRVLRLFEDEEMISNVKEVMRRLNDPHFSHAQVSIAVLELVSRGSLDTSIEGIRLVRR
ncbi:MAG: hypothetical protein OXS29_06035 [bacterium]|nr:hypothetical protein [bacterium]MDE0287801.1 hypothetical protein [bacterium]MDE0438292.1 hypothetical protein [bacterium]